MTFAEIRQEVKSRLNGTRFLSDVRVNKFINQAQQELDRMYCWPYREKSTTGVAPYTITDLDQVEAVTDTTLHTSLTPIDFKILLDTFGDLSVTGTPLYYYIAWPSGVPQLATYPVSTDTIGIQYWKITTDLSADADVPTCPSSFHSLLTDLAVRRAYQAQNMPKEADAMQVDIDRQLQYMLVALNPGTPDGPASYQLVQTQDY